MAVNAKLKKVLDTHLPVTESSSRSIQRVAALWLGHSTGKIDPAELRQLCNDLELFDYEGRAGGNNFGANFTQNMKKDATYFPGDHTSGWKLSAEGKAEAKRIFEDGEAPTRRRIEGGAKPKKAAKPKPAAKPAAKSKKASGKATKPAAAKKGGKKGSAPAPAGDEASRKAAAKKRALQKKRDLGSSGAPPVSAPAPAEAGAAAPG